MIYRFEEFTLNTAKREVHRGAEAVKIEPRTYELLIYLLENRDRAIGKDELQDKVWGTIVSDSAMTRGVMKLRKSLGDTSDAIIKTVPRFGYRFVAEVESLPEPAQPVSSQAPARPAPPQKRNHLLLLVVAAAIVAVLFATVFRDAWIKPAVDPKSIAVLPFDDLSESQDQQWFADGLAEEILNSLARTPDLSVTGRTSSFAFRDSNQGIPSIAGALGVAHILEGSVRREGDQIRVTAQLIRARDGMHLWSENFDHPAANLIQVQESIAINIALALKTAMDPEALAALVSSGTRSVAAFEAYLRGLAGYTSMLETGDVDAYMGAIDAFEQAVEIDPEFALAHGEIANYWMTQLSQVAIASGRQDKSVAEIRAASEKALDNAIRYSGDPVRKLRFQVIKAVAEVKLRQALQLSSEFLEKRPHDRQAQSRHLNLLAQLNMFDEVTRLAFEFFERDGFDPAVTGRSIHTMIYSNNEEAIRAFLDLVSEHLVHNTIAMYQAHRGLLWIGEVARARELHDQLIASDLRGSLKAHTRLRQLCAEGRVDEAQQLYEKANAEISNRRSFPWLTANTMGYPDQGLATAHRLDEDRNLYALAGFLLYGTFDPRPFPNLMAHLEIHGNETGHVTEVPYRCFRNETE
ncbi:MAG: winged helix-turn-helix domain-containing protein [Gammaproteobacteria bacterium]|nr:winged helix-turn-helix domain-containing protein [Gammaproteobacteria bacterium]